MSEQDKFARFVAARSPALLRSAWLLTGSRASAEDLVQTALAHTWARWSRVEQQDARLRDSPALLGLRDEVTP